MERFEEAIYKQREEINERMTEIFNLLKEYMKGKSPEKVLVKEEIGKPDTKYVNAISLVRMKNSKGCLNHWKEIHVTWAQLAKKRDEDTTLQDFDGAMELTVHGDGVANPFDIVSA
ncbi:hypothetical protein Tco_0348097 [Tanacetum coccineum]